MASKKSYINTTVSTELLKSLRALGANEGLRINELLEEAIQDLIKKYEQKNREKEYQEMLAKSVTSDQQIELPFVEKIAELVWYKLKDKK